MAQLRYTKHMVVCSTAAITAFGLGVYLYKRRATRRNVKQNECVDKEQGRELTEVESTSMKEVISENNESAQIASTFTGAEPCMPSRDSPSDSHPPTLENSGVEFDLIASSESAVLQLQPQGDIEETIRQALPSTVESALPPTVETLRLSTVESGLPPSDEEDEKGLLTLDWAKTMEKIEAEVESPKEKSLMSPAMSIHSHPEGSVAGSDLSTESNSDSSSLDSGRCTGSTTSTSVQPLGVQPPLPEMASVYQFTFPADECGRLIGKAGKNIKGIRNRTGCKVTVFDMPGDKTMKICVLEGLQSEVDAALADIQKKFPMIDTSTPYIEMEQMPPEVNTPQVTMVHLHDEIINDVLVSSVVSAGHVFIQQPTHPTYMQLTRLDNFMNTCYTQSEIVPELPKPIEVGVICAAPMMQGWYRAQIVDIYPSTDEVDIKFVDYGGYARTDSYALKQIRTDFMSLPIQATECYLSNIAPVSGDGDFSENARIFVEQVAQSFSILQAQVTGYSEDGIPFIELFYTDSERKVQSLNKELVNQGLVTWYEGGEEISEETTYLPEEEIVQ